MTEISALPCPLLRRARGREYWLKRYVQLLAQEPMPTEALQRCYQSLLLFSPNAPKSPKNSAQHHLKT